MNRGRNNFDVIRYDYYRDETVAFEAFKAGDIRHPPGEHRAQDWATALRRPRGAATGCIKKDEIPHERPTGMQGFVFNTAPRRSSRTARVREALGYAFDFEWTNRNLFYGLYTRTSSYSSTTPSWPRRGLPRPAELQVLEPLRGKIPDEVFTTEYKPPETDGSGNIRDNARRALALLKEAGWEIKDGKLIDAKTGSRSRFEILLIDAGLRAHRPAVQQEPRAPRHRRERAHRRHRRSTSSRIDDFDFDMIVDGLRPVAVARQRAARLLGLRGRRHAGQPQHHRHQGSGDRRAGRAR